MDQAGRLRAPRSHQQRRRCRGGGWSRAGRGRKVRPGPPGCGRADIESIQDAYSKVDSIVARAYDYDSYGVDKGKGAPPSLHRVLDGEAPTGPRLAGLASSAAQRGGRLSLSPLLRKRLRLLRSGQGLRRVPLCTDCTIELCSGEKSPHLPY